MLLLLLLCAVSARLLLPDRPRAPAHHGAHCFAAVQQHLFISSYYFIVISIDNKSKIWYHNLTSLLLEI
jgi:hypothetical protein